MSLIDWELYTERAVGRGSPTYADVANRPLREVLTASGLNPDADFPGFSLAGHTHDASAIVSGTVPPARGGTGLSSPTLGGLLIAAGALAMTLLAPGLSGQVVKSTGTAWGSAAIVAADVSDLPTAATGITKVGTLTVGAIGAGFTAIPDSALAQLATAGKVANSATTAASANTPGAIVARDASGNFTAGTVTAALSGNASTATVLATARAINGVTFDGSAPITIKATATNALTIGAHLTGGAYDGSAPVTLATDATNLNTVSTIVARDASGNFSAGTITATLAGNANTATKLAAAVAINGVAFDGSGAVTVTAAANTLTGTILAVNVVTSSLTAVGTIGAGVWQGTLIAPLFGGTGVANSNTITLGGNISTASAFTTVGAFGLTLTTTGATNVTLPTSGTLVNTAVATLSNLTTIGTLGALNVAGVTTLTSTSAVALAVGANGATNPAFQVDASATSAATGLKVTANAATGGLALAVISSALNDALSIDAKGTGTITLGGTSTGAITLGQSTTLASGKTLTLTGVTVAGAPTWSSGQTFPSLAVSGASALQAITATTLTQTGLLSVNGGSAGQAARFYFGSGANRPLNIGIRQGSGDAYLGWNAVQAAGDVQNYDIANVASRILSAGAAGAGFTFSAAAAGSAGAAITWTDLLTLDLTAARFRTGLTVDTGLTVSAGGLAVNAGTTTLQAVTAISASLSGSGAGGGLLLTGADPRIIATPTGNPFEIGTSNANNLTFFTNNSTVGILTSSGSFVWGVAAIATTATDGFLYIPTCAGAPTGVPTAFAGRLPMVYDTTNHKFWMYDGGWKGVVLA